VLAQTIFEAIKIKAEAGLDRNPFTGRPCPKLSDEDAARQAAPDESTAQLVALILATRNEAFVDWARNIQILAKGQTRSPKSRGITRTPKRGRMSDYLIC
jgi:hypothetical protein